jgi:hypothetical protein
LILANVSRRVGSNATLIVIGVSASMIRIGGDTDGDLQDFSSGTGFNGIIARDTATVSQNYNVTFIPMTFLIDTVGNIRYKHVGVVDSAEDIIVNELKIIPEYPTIVILLLTMSLSSIVVAVGVKHYSHRNRILKKTSF